MTAEPLIDPFTGRELDPDSDVLRKIAGQADEYLTRAYAAAREVRERRDAILRVLADRGEYELPDRRHRTKVQERVAACPRCGDKPPPPA